MKCETCGLEDGHANRCYADGILLSDVRKLEAEKAKLYEQVLSLQELNEYRQHKIDKLVLQLSEERERCAKLAEEFEDWIWPDKKSEAYQEAGDWASPLLIESMKRLAAEIRKQPEKPKSEEVACPGCGATAMCACKV